MSCPHLPIARALPRFSLGEKLSAELTDEGLQFCDVGSPSSVMLRMTPSPLGRRSCARNDGSEVI